MRCVICEKRDAVVLADSDSIQYQNGMPVCQPCYDERDLDPHEDNICGGGTNRG